ncbi:MAG TPA: ATP synthase F1 subunit delta [Bacteroidetes bacterium]|jgi:F-type H+-transporting ATPase subunit delta|nr:ATP synthase F1 subunit delta [Bacteroidota bacterium]
MKNVRVARRYAMALMAATEQQKNIDGTAKDLVLIAKILQDSRDLRLLVASPVISPAKKRAVFNELLATRVGKETLRFINLLISKSREAILYDLIEQYKELHDEKLGIVNVSVRMVVELNYAQEKDLRAQLERITGKKVRLQTLIDKTIKGGLVIRIADTVLDASVSHQLDRMRELLVAGQAA